MGNKLYEGDYSEGKWHGKGIKYYKNGNKQYEGDYSENKWHGKGIKYYENGNKQYEGEYSENKWHGKGIQYFQDGTELHGQWVEGKQHGEMIRCVKETWNMGRKI